MRLMLLYNPIAGAGRSRREAERLRGVLHEAGHDVKLEATRLEPTARWLDPALDGLDLLVVAGGDGAMRLAAGAAVRTSTPIYHFPLGTENLFSREFGMTRCPRALLGGIERGAVTSVDVGAANGRTFLLMASIGYDAEVVHDLASHRGAGISHLTYAGPIMRQLRRWRPPRMTVIVDGERIVDDEPGFAVVGNSRQYARRLDPAVRASMTDGVLDVVFFPTRSRLDLARWAWGCARHRHVHDSRLVYRLGREVRVLCSEPQRFQIDGDPPESGRAGDAAERIDELSIALRPAVLPVLLPAPPRESPGPG